MLLYYVVLNMNMFFYVFVYYENNREDQTLSIILVYMRRVISLIFVRFWITLSALVFSFLHKFVKNM